MKRQFIQLSLACGLSAGLSQHSNAQIVTIPVSFDQSVNDQYFTGILNNEEIALSTTFYDPFDEEVVFFFLKDGQNIYAKGTLNESGLDANANYYRNGKLVKAIYKLTFDSPTLLSGTITIDGVKHEVQLVNESRSITDVLDASKAKVMKENFGNYFSLYLIDKVKLMEFKEEKSYVENDVIITPVVEQKTGVRGFRVNHTLFENQLDNINSALEATHYNLAIGYWNTKVNKEPNKSVGNITPRIWNGTYIEAISSFSKDGNLANASTNSDFYRIIDGKRVDFLDIFQFSDDQRENFSGKAFEILNELLTRLHGKKYTDKKLEQVDKLRFGNFDTKITEEGVYIDFSFPIKGSTPLLIPKSELIQYQVLFSELYN